MSSPLQISRTAQASPRALIGGLSSQLSAAAIGDGPSAAPQSLRSSAPGPGEPGLAVPAGMAPLTVSEGAGEVTVVTETAHGMVVVGIDKRTGWVSRYQVGDRELLKEPLQLCMFRAPTDNDRGGSGGTSYAFRWMRAGLHALRVDHGADVEVVSSTEGEGEWGWQGTTARQSCMSMQVRSSPIRHAPWFALCTRSDAPGHAVHAARGVQGTQGVDGRGDGGGGGGGDGRHALVRAGMVTWEQPWRQPQCG